MTNPSITIQERTEQFAIRIIKAYTEINKKNHFIFGNYLGFYHNINPVATFRCFFNCDTIF